MNYIFTLSLVLLFVIPSFSQECDDCYTDKAISTNPQNPENCDLDKQANGKVNQLLNTFDWGAYNRNVFGSVELNRRAGWQIPYLNPVANILMSSPMESSFFNLYGGVPIQDHDFQWEDGWELMWLNTGYWPNGTGYDVADTNNLIGFVNSLKNPRVPYIILYNRYTGKMRFFLNVFTSSLFQDDLALEIGYVNRNNSSGIFRHGNNLDKPLDQKTTTPAFSTQMKNPYNDTKWHVADIQLGYDPCICESASTFNIELYTVTYSDQELLSRDQVVEREISKNGFPQFKNYYNFNSDDLNTDASGALVHRSFESMLSEYSNEFSIYKSQFKNQNEESALLHSTIYSLAEEDAKLGLRSIVSPSISDQFGSKIAGVFNPINNSPLDTTNFEIYSNKLNTITKAALGNLSDQMFLSLASRPNYPVKPTLPIASFSDMRIRGVLQKRTWISLGFYSAPGFMVGSSNGVWSPKTYPIYNKPVGLFALLETPSIMAWSEVEDRIESRTDAASKGIIYSYKKAVNTSFKLKVPLSYKFNNNVDIDLDKTKLYGQYRVEVAKNSFQKEKTNIKLLEDNNFVVLHDLEEEIILQTDWIPIEILGEIVASLGLQVNHGEITTNSDNYEPELNKVKLSLMADIYFDSLGADGKELNTVQVFTYELFDKKKGLDKISEKGDWKKDRKEVQKYQQGTIAIKDEEINPNSPFVWEVNGAYIYIKAEHITLEGDVTVADGYKAILEAFWDIEVNPTIDLSAIEFSVKKDFYNFPASRQMTVAELRQFCGSNKYKANEIESGLLNQNFIPESQGNNASSEENDIQIELFPNPTTDIINLKIKGLPSLVNSSIKVIDLKGRQIAVNVINSKEYSIDVSSLSQGVYLVEVIHGDQKEVRRFVKM